MSTAPFLARAATDVTQGFEPRLSGVATYWQDWPSTQVALDIITAQITEDESWSPRIQVELTVARTPEVEALDPRLGVHIDLTTGYRYLDGTVDEWPTYYYLVLREVAPVPGEGTVTLTAVSAECLFIDYADDQPLWGFATIEEYLTLGGIDAVTPPNSPLRSWWSLAPGRNLVDADVTMGVHKHEDVPTFWAEPLSAACEARDLEWFVAREGILTVRQRVTATGTPVHTLATGPNGTVTDYRPVVTMDDYANDVWVTYSGAIGARSHEAFNSKPMVSVVIDRSNVEMPSLADRAAAASAIYRRLKSYGRTEELVAAMALWLRPGDTVTIAPEGETPYNRIVRRVSFRFPAGDMTVSTRNPE